MNEYEIRYVGDVRPLPWRCFCVEPRRARFDNKYVCGNCGCDIVERFAKLGKEVER